MEYDLCKKYMTEKNAKQIFSLFLLDRYKLLRMLNLANFLKMSI
jgi:hypothetical protein